MKIKQNYVLRNIADEYIVVPIGDEADRLHGVITLSESGAFLWEKLATEQTAETLTDALTAEYKVDWETALKDVQSFLDSIGQMGCLEE